MKKDRLVQGLICNLPDAKNMKKRYVAVGLYGEKNNWLIKAGHTKGKGKPFVRKLALTNLAMSGVIKMFVDISNAEIKKESHERE
jgi:hypothetical protein